MNTALEAYVLIARYYQVYHSVDTLKRDHEIKEDDMSSLDLTLLINQTGLNAKCEKLRWRQLSKLGAAFPVILKLKHGDFVIAAGVQSTSEGKLEVLIQDPKAESTELLSVDEATFRRCWKGDVIFVRPLGVDVGIEQPFGFGWLFHEHLSSQAYFTL